MSVLDEVDVRKAMRAQLKTVTTLPDDNLIAWEHRSFTPPSLGAKTTDRPLWVAEQTSILGERHAASCTLEVIGETLWMVNTQSGRGTREADDLAKAIADAFRPPRSLIGGTETVSIDRVERRPYRMNQQFDTWIFKTVAVMWRAFTTTSD